jgi:hypothetical protein
MRDRSGKEVFAQGGLEIGNEFLKNAGRGFERGLNLGRLGCCRLGYGTLGVEHWRRFDMRSFHGRGRHMRDRSRQFRSNFFDCGRLFVHDRIFLSNCGNFFDGEFGRRLVDGEFRDGFDGSNFFHCGSGLRSGFDFDP